MPTVTIRYTLPDESMEHRAALAGVDALVALEKIDQWARGRLKHAEPTVDEVHALQAVRAMIPVELLEILN
jgi:hypothetical protein